MTSRPCFCWYWCFGSSENDISVSWIFCPVPGHVGYPELGDWDSLLLSVSVCLTLLHLSAPLSWISFWSSEMSLSVVERRRAPSCSSMPAVTGSFPSQTTGWSQPWRNVSMSSHQSESWSAPRLLHWTSTELANPIEAGLAPLWRNYIFGNYIILNTYSGLNLPIVS